MLPTDYLWNMSKTPISSQWPNGYSNLVLSSVWAKSLTPGLALINNFQKMVISFRIDCCAET